LAEEDSGGQAAPLTPTSPSPIEGEGTMPVRQREH
jgi:hypothetical protein